MKKQFVVFLGIAQLIIIVGHLAIYGAALLFFPVLRLHAIGFLILTFVLSVSFLTISILDFKHENLIIRIAYILTACWVPCFGYMLAGSVIGSLLFLVLPNNGMQIGIITYGSAVLMVAYGTINARVIQTTYQTVELPNMPEYWKGKKAVIVSDLHLGHVLRKGFAEKVIKKINALRPDIIFIPGDFFDGVKTDFNELADTFKNLSSKHGTFYVTGNHEQIAGYKVCEDAIAKAGIHILENTKVEINQLQILGLAYFPESQETEEQVKTLLKGMQIDGQKPSILLKHVPNRPEAAANAGVSLQLSGHTHHGQVWPGRFITRRAYKGFHYGLKKIGNFQLFVSSGVGTWGPPVRTFTKSEIVEITFKA